MYHCPNLHRFSIIYYESELNFGKFRKIVGIGKKGLKFMGIGKNGQKIWGIGKIIPPCHPPQ